MGRLLANGFETTFYREEGPNKVLLPPKKCHFALWDPIDSVDGATVRVLMDILGSDVEFYGHLFGTGHLAGYLSEPSRGPGPFRYVKFKWVAEVSLYEEGLENFQLYPTFTGIGRSEDPKSQDADEDVDYALDFVPLPSLADLQIVISDIVSVDVYRGKGRHEKLTLGRMPLCLMDVLRVLVEEASFHGVPKERDGRLKDLEERAKQVNADVASGKIKDYVTLEEIKAKCGLGQDKVETGVGSDEGGKLAELVKKVEMYEGLLHDVQMHAEVTLRGDRVSELIANICRWSYAHRVGNGENTEEEQDKMVRKAFERLREVGSDKEPRGQPPQ
jgi:hypothetical protein